MRDPRSVQRSEMLKRKPPTTSGVDLPSNLWYWLEQARTRSREECRGGLRPCPCVSCEHHLLFQVNAKEPKRWEIQPIEIHEMKDTCSLDLLERSGVPTLTPSLESKPLPPHHMDSKIEINVPEAVTIGVTPSSPSSQK